MLTIHAAGLLEDKMQHDAAQLPCTLQQILNAYDIASAEAENTLPSIDTVAGEAMSISSLKLAQGKAQSYL